MSNRSCNKCVQGKIDNDIADRHCQACILRDNFLRSETPVRLVRLPVGDDRVLSPLDQWELDWEAY